MLNVQLIEFRNRHKGKGRQRGVGGGTHYNNITVMGEMEEHLCLGKKGGISSVDVKAAESTRVLIRPLKKARSFRGYLTLFCSKRPRFCTCFYLSFA